MNSFSRLKEERKRLGLNQEEFGELGGVKRLAQSNYEKGERKPDQDYFKGIAKAGVDISYVITGVRSDSQAKALNDERFVIGEEPAKYGECPPDIEKLLKAYQDADPAIKAAVLRVLGVEE